MSEGFDDSRWKSGLAPFGNESAKIRTEWKTSDIFLRKTFEYDGGELKNGALVISYDDDNEVYVNG